MKDILDIVLHDKVYKAVVGFTVAICLPWILQSIIDLNQRIAVHIAVAETKLIDLDRRLTVLEGKIPFRIPETKRPTHALSKDERRTEIRLVK